MENQKTQSSNSTGRRAAWKELAYATQHLSSARDYVKELDISEASEVETEIWRELFNISDQIRKHRSKLETLNHLGKTLYYNVEGCDVAAKPEISVENTLKVFCTIFRDGDEINSFEVSTLTDVEAFAIGLIKRVAA